MAGLRLVFSPLPEGPPVRVKGRQPGLCAAPALCGGAGCGPGPPFSSR